MIKTARLIFTFYRSFMAALVAVTLCCLAIVWQFGPAAFGHVFWIKVFSSAIVFFYINKYKNNEYFYYRNLGISKLKLWLASLLLDFGLFIILAVLISNLR